MNEVISWFEIPAANFERAVNFYGAVLDSKLRAGEFMGTPHGFVEDKKGERRGAVIPNTNPAVYAGGPLIYLRVDNVEDVVKRVAAAGGTVLIPKTSIGPQGEIAIIRDSEGNSVGLHSAAE